MKKLFKKYIINPIIEGLFVAPVRYKLVRLAYLKWLKKQFEDEK
jgi:hypothetical protein